MAQGLTPRSYERWRAWWMRSSRAGAVRRAAPNWARRGPRRYAPAVLNRMATRAGCSGTPVAGWRDAHSSTAAWPRPAHVRLNDLDPAHAAYFIERYVARYGGLLDDIAWWTGLGVRRCRDACTNSARRSRRCAYRGGTASAG